RQERQGGAAAERPMKTDVVPPRLDIPSWVPEPIAQYISAKYAAAVDGVYREALRESESGYFEQGVPEDHLDNLVRDNLVRASVADLVRDELADITERYLPLTCDRRMKSVWWELSKRRNGAFLHPARAGRQDTAMLELFDAALACQRRHREPMTRGKVEQQRHR